LDVLGYLAIKDVTRAMAESPVGTFFPRINARNMFDAQGKTIFVRAAGGDVFKIVSVS
jgi:hypothetical protein